jgi:hypothetical protein
MSDTGHIINDAVAPTPEVPAAGDAPALTFLDPAKLRFFRAGATLRLEVAGECTWIKVTVLRTFPLSCPNSHFSIRDGGGAEIGLLLTPDGLDAASRREIEAELERRYMMAIIRRIVSITERFGTVDWEVETNRGFCRFTTRDLRENAIRFGANHYLLTDVENNRFEIPDMDALDARSQAMLLRHL